MSRYFVFQSQSETIKSEDCTTSLPNTVVCRIRATGIYLSKRTNLMELTGPEVDIDAWKSSNEGKVSECTLSEINAVGQNMYPAGVVKTVVCEYGYTHTLVSQTFDISSGQAWVDNDVKM